MDSPAPSAGVSIPGKEQEPHYSTLSFQEDPSTSEYSELRL